MLAAADARDDLSGRTVADLGCGTGILAIGALLLGAARAVGIEVDPTAAALARSNAQAVGVALDVVNGPVDSWQEPVDTVLMNPPFGAQRRHADRPFWAAAFRLARRRIYAFALADSRTFIGRTTVAAGGRVEETGPVEWSLPPTFAHHARRRMDLPVDLWVLSPPPR
jgi:putative methylase